MTTIKQMEKDLTQLRTQIKKTRVEKFLAIVDNLSDLGVNYYERELLNIITKLDEKLGFRDVILLMVYMESSISPGPIHLEKVKRLFQTFMDMSAHNIGSSKYDMDKMLKYLGTLSGRNRKIFSHANRAATLSRRGLPKNAVLISSSETVYNVNGKGYRNKYYHPNRENIKKFLVS